MTDSGCYAYDVESSGCFLYSDGLSGGTDFVFFLPCDVFPRRRPRGVRRDSSRSASNRRVVGIRGLL